MASGFYLWQPNLCPSCGKARDPSRCHLCGGRVHPKTWEDLGLRPPPPDPLVFEIEELAGRVTSDYRVILSELREATCHLDLTPPELHRAEALVRAYASGMAHEDRRRRDTAAAQGRAQPTATSGATYRNPG